MDVEHLRLLRKIWPAVYIPHAPNPDPKALAIGLASLLPPPTRIFCVESDTLTPEEGRTLVDALVNSPTVILFGSSDSKLIQSLGHRWPDYCENAAHSYVTFAQHVSLGAPPGPERLARVYLLIPTLTAAHHSDRPGVFRLSSADTDRLVALASGAKLSAEPLGRVAAQTAPREISIRDLCLLHARDSVPTQYRPLGAFVDESGPLSWRDLQTFLRTQPDHQLLDYLRPQFTPEQYGYALTALEFIREHQSAMSGHVFPDIYSATWAMERTFSPETIFRGQFRAEWGLDSTLLRGDKRGPPDVSELLKRIDHTSSFIAALRERSIELLGKQADEDSLLAVAQHFGFPTPLLDFTESFRVAAFFATQHARQLEPEESPPIGVIFSISPPDKKHTLADSPDSRRLMEWAGIRPGLLHLIRPDLPKEDNRIARQAGVFIGGYRARDLQAVTIDRIYFKQHRSLTFEDPTSGITANELLPERTALSELAREVRNRPVPSRPMSSLLSGTRIGDSSLIGSADAHLYWHLRRGQEYLTELKEHTDRIGAPQLQRAMQTALDQYFSLARVEADISTMPDPKDPDTRAIPIHKAIAALEESAALPEGQIWKLLEDQLPKGFEFGGHINFQLPESWTETAHLAFSCAMFCVAWEHLRCVSGQRAQELVQSATLHLLRK